MGIVLLVEDNPQLNEINRRALEYMGCEVLTALTLAEARIQLSVASPDVILLDVLLPDGNGINFCEEIRDKTDAHILFLTSKTDQEDRIRGLVIGGDDYIAKPYKLEELLARVQAALRRRDMDKAPSKILSLGNLMLDILASQAFVDGSDLLLTPKEFALLHLFAQNVNKTMIAEHLYEEIWKQPLMEDKRTLQKHISELRNKLTERNCGHTITAVYGKGYRFEKDIPLEC